MATFNIKRGDSMPPLIVAMRVAGTGTDNTNPVQYWDFSHDDVGNTTDNAEQNGLVKGIDHVNFVMYRNAGNIIGNPADKALRRTGPGILYQSGGIWVLRYNWRQPHPLFDPTKGIGNQDSPLYYEGDTALVGTYFAEFEIYYQTTGTVDSQLKKRTFPSTPGDQIIINILPDGNDITAGQSA